MAIPAIDLRVEEQSWLDAVAKPIQKPMSNLLGSNKGLRSFLHGTWLGHALHPVLTDVPVGSWTAAAVMDALELSGVESLRSGADACVNIGLVGAAGAAVTGYAEWSHTDGGGRRLGLVHGLTNVVVTSLYVGSTIARRANNRRLGIYLSMAGYALSSFSAYLGGELSLKLGVGVNQAAFEEPKREWIAVLDESALKEGELRKVDFDGVPVLLARDQAMIYAIGNTCTHLRAPLNEGTLEDGCVVCPWHGSHFKLDGGTAVVGPASANARAYDVRVANGRIELRPRKSD